MHKISHAAFFCSVFCVANMEVIICHLRSNFCWRLCSGCLIWVLNKLPRPCSSFCLPTLLPLLPSLPPPHSLSFFFGMQCNSTSNTDSHRQQKRKHLSVFKDELPCSPSTTLQEIVRSCLRATVVFAFFTDRERYSVLVGSEPFRVSCFYNGGPGIFHTRLTWHFCLALLSNACVKPAYTETLNSMNLKSLSTFSMVEDCSWMLDGFSDKIIIQPAHLFLMCCVGGAQNKWIFMNVRKAYMYHSDFHPCHQAMQITSSHLHTATQPPLSP